VRTTLRTALLMAFLIALLALGGWAFGGRAGLLFMAVIGLALNFGVYWFSDRIALRSNHARQVTREEAPELHRIVDHLSYEAGLPKPPVYIIPSTSPNAFATGRGPNHSAVAVTEGLLELLDARELEAVLSHELSHVRNRDVLIGTVAAGIAGIISSVGWVLQFGVARGRERGSGLAALAWLILAPIVALLLQLAISRAREYAADDSGAKLSGDPGALADALEKIAAGSQQRPYEFAAPATAHLFIVNPLRGTLQRLLSTHPPIAERIAHLREAHA
jgi:heat shock protein HtpX